MRKGGTLGASQRLCADVWDGLGSQRLPGTADPGPKNSLDYKLAAFTAATLQPGGGFLVLVEEAVSGAEGKGQTAAGPAGALSALAPAPRPLSLMEA